MEHNKIITDNMLRIMSEKGITQSEVAKQIGMKQPALSRYKEGTRKFSISLVIGVANALGVSVFELLDGIPEFDGGVSIAPIKIHRKYRDSVVFF